jgi:hypothetical protein
MVMLALFGILFSACGGGGESVGSSAQTPQPPPAAKILSWDPPASFTDGTPLNPVVDLQDFEIYIRQDASFGATDQVAAVVAPADRSFNLALLAPSLSRGTTYYVSLRAVCTNGMKSDFSPSASFSF